MRARQDITRIAVAAGLAVAGWGTAAGQATAVSPGTCSVALTSSQAGATSVKVVVQATCGSSVQTIAHDLTVTRDGTTVGTAGKQCRRPSGSTSTLVCTVTDTFADPDGTQTFVATDRITVAVTDGTVQRLVRSVTFTS